MVGKILLLLALIFLGRVLLNLHHIYINVLVNFIILGESKKISFEKNFMIDFNCQMLFDIVYNFFYYVTIGITHLIKNQ